MKNLWNELSMALKKTIGSKLTRFSAKEPEQNFCGSLQGRFAQCEAEYPCMAVSIIVYLLAALLPGKAEKHLHAYVRSTRDLVLAVPEGFNYSAENFRGLMKVKYGLLLIKELNKLQAKKGRLQEICFLKSLQEANFTNFQLWETRWKRQFLPMG